MSPEERPTTTAYRLLLVHPNAPSELIANNYWALAGVLQERRESGEDVDAALHHLTRSYEQLSDPSRRSEYNKTIDFDEESLRTRPVRIPRRSLARRILRRPARVSVDLYEVIGLDAAAHTELVAGAERVMRDQYLRLNSDKRRRALLGLLSESYRTLRDPADRRKYDDGRSNGASPKPDSAKEQSGKKAKLPVADRPTDDQRTPPSPRGPRGIRFRRAGAGIARGIGVAGAKLLSAGLLGARSLARGLGWAAGHSRNAIQRVRAHRPDSPSGDKPKPRTVRPRVHPTSVRPVKVDQEEVEDRFLGRVANSVSESESHLTRDNPPASPSETP